MKMTSFCEMFQRFGKEIDDRFNKLSRENGELKSKILLLEDEFESKVDAKIDGKLAKFLLSDEFKDAVELNKKFFDLVKLDEYLGNNSVLTMKNCKKMLDVITNHVNQNTIVVNEMVTSFAKNYGNECSSLGNSITSLRKDISEQLKQLKDTVAKLNAAESDMRKEIAETKSSAAEAHHKGNNLIGMISSNKKSIDELRTYMKDELRQNVKALISDPELTKDLKVELYEGLADGAAGILSNIEDVNMDGVMLNGVSLLSTEDLVKHVASELNQEYEQRDDECQQVTLEEHVDEPSNDERKMELQADEIVVDETKIAKSVSDYLMQVEKSTLVSDEDDADSVVSMTESIATSTDTNGIMDNLEALRAVALLKDTPENSLYTQNLFSMDDDPDEVPTDNKSKSDDILSKPHEYAKLIKSYDIRDDKAAVGSQFNEHLSANQIGMFMEKTGCTGKVLVLHYPIDVVANKIYFGRVTDDKQDVVHVWSYFLYEAIRILLKLEISSEASYAVTVSELKESPTMMDASRVCKLANDMLSHVHHVWNVASHGLIFYGDMSDIDDFEHEENHSIRRSIPTMMIDINMPVRVVIPARVLDTTVQPRAVVCLSSECTNDCDTKINEITLAATVSGATKIHYDNGNHLAIIEYSWSNVSAFRVVSICTKSTDYGSELYLYNRSKVNFSGQWYFDFQKKATGVVVGKQVINATIGDGLRELIVLTQRYAKGEDVLPSEVVEAVVASIHSNKRANTIRRVRKIVDTIYNNVNLSNCGKGWANLCQKVGSPFRDGYHCADWYKSEKSGKTRFVCSELWTYLHMNDKLLLDDVQREKLLRACGHRCLGFVGSSMSKSVIGVTSKSFCGRFASWLVTTYP